MPRRAVELVLVIIVFVALMLGTADLASGDDGTPHEPTDDATAATTPTTAEPAPFGLEPVELGVQATARRVGEDAAAEIRGRVRRTTEARIELAATGSDEARAEVEAVLAALELAAIGVQEAGSEIDEIQFAHRELVDDHREAAETLDGHMAALYVRGPTRVVDALIDGYDLAAARTRGILLDVVLEGDRDRLVGSFVAATTDVADVRALSERLQADLTVREALGAQRKAALEAADQSDEALAALQDLRDDLAFPVAGTHNFVDTFLAARMAGTPDVHRHQGIDIFAAEGAPLVAVERGVLVRIGNNRLGGLRLWLIGESGTNYYYAHLSAFADVTEGEFVEAGTVVGYVGNTGNARSTPPHVHFQVHPDGGGAVNAFPLLRQLSDRDAALIDSGGVAYGLCPRPDALLSDTCSG